MSLSLVLSSVPEELDDARDFIDHWRSLSEVSQCILVLPHSTVEKEKCRFYETALQVQDDFFRVESFENVSTLSQRLNASIQLVESENVLFMEGPFFVEAEAIREAVEELSIEERSLVELPRKQVLENCHLEQSELSSWISIADMPICKVLGVRKSYFLELRGFDESIGNSPLLGLDLITRHRRRKGKVARLSHESCATIYSGTKLAWNTDSQTRALEALHSNRSIFRNLQSWSVPMEFRTPLISVCIATKDRGDMLIESIRSVQYQTFQEFEIVVVDDGSEDQDSVRELVAGLKDPRIRFVAHDRSKGVAAARNTAASLSRCMLTAVHDDDDLMLPDRLEVGISRLSDEVDASYGSWINFDDETGELQGFISRDGFGGEMVADNGAGPGHSTWTLPTEVIRQFRYDENLSSSVDHELATRLANAGLRWRHTGQFMYLRRVHTSQITAQDSDNQKAGHTLSCLGNRFLATETGVKEMANKGKSLKYPQVPGRESLFENFGAYLPDHLVSRELVLRGDTINQAMKTNMPERLGAIVTERDLVNDRGLFEEAIIKDTTQEDFVRLRMKGFARVEARPIRYLPDLIEGKPKNAREELLSRAMQRLNSSKWHVREQFPGCPQLILYFKEGIPELLANEMLAGTLAVRRTIAVDEFGLKCAFFLFAFEGVAEMLQAMRHLKKKVPSATGFYFAEVAFEDLPREMVRNGERPFDTYANDSGLLEG